MKTEERRYKVCSNCEHYYVTCCDEVICEKDHDILYSITGKAKNCKDFGLED